MFGMNAQIKFGSFLHDDEYFVFGFFPGQSFFDDVFLAKMSLFFCFVCPQKFMELILTTHSFFFIILQKISSLISLNRCMAYARKSFFLFFFLFRGRHRTINDETNEIVFVFLIFFSYVNNLTRFFFCFLFLMEEMIFKDDI